MNSSRVYFWTFTGIFSLFNFENQNNLIPEEEERFKKRTVQTKCNILSVIHTLKLNIFIRTMAVFCVT